MDPLILEEPKPEPKKRLTTIYIIGFLVLVLGLYLFATFFVSPSGFNDVKKNGVYVDVKQGMGARQVAILLYENRIISSPTAFVSIVSILKKENDISSGMYLFKAPKNIFDAVEIITKGKYGISAKKITIPEGFTLYQIADRLEANLTHFDKQKFIRIASSSDGLLYPETYYFLPSDTEEVIFDKMIKTFKEKTETLEESFLNSSRSKSEIIIMASILEREVKTKEDKQIVSGLLWNRIKIGMPLQVDATLAFERNKDSYTLTTADLRADSPYNSYTRKGLPPTPISNPGFDAIYAALNPTENSYVYFLTDRDGKVYYSKTYSEHLRYKAKYI